MELSRGICVLCTNNTKVVLPPQAEDITNLLWDILENKIDIRKFDETSTTLKVCPSCLHDVLQVAEYKQNLDEFSESTRSCSLCRDYEHLISIADWKHFNVLLQNITSQKIRKCSVCVHCIKFLELLERIKVNFLNRYPQLTLKKTARDRKYDDLKSALKHLKPLKYSNFNIDQYKGDQKLLKQVAFVKLSITNQTTKDGISSQPRKFKKLRLSSLNDCDSLRGSSPKPSFFKIKLKLNTTKPKTNKMISEKVTEPKNTLKVPPSEKQLVVNIFKMDFNKINQTTAASDSDGDEPFKTPTKASLKMMPEDSLSSSRKRKSVTFAEDLNVEITDGVSSRKDNSDGSPLKSLLKKNDSPTADLFKNSSVEDSSDDDTELITNIVNKINGNRISSDDEMDVSTNYGQGNTDNIKILDAPNKLIGNTHEDYSDNRDDIGNKHFDNERASSKKRKIIDVNSEVGDDGNIETNDEKLKNPNKKKKGSDFENKGEEILNENGYNAVASNNNYGSKSGKKHDHDLLKNMIDKGHISESEDKADILDSEFESVSGKSDETAMSTDETLKPKKLFSHFDSVSVSSDSSKEDTIITLGEYKKIRKSAETNDKSDDSSEEPLDPLCIESDDIPEQFYSLENTDSNITNNSSVIIEPRRNISEVRADEEKEDNYLTDKNKAYEESETKTDKVSENNSEQGDIQNACSLLKDTSQLSETPVCDSNHKVLPTGPNMDNEYTVSDRQNVESGNQDTEQQHMEYSVDAEAIIENSCVTQVLDKSVIESIETSDNCGPLDLSDQQGISLSNAIQSGDNIDLNKLNTDSGGEISSSSNYVTSTRVDVSTDKTLSTAV